MTHKKTTILVIDDTEINIRTIELILKKEGYTILKASNSTEAFKWLEKIRPDLILLDVVMPDMNGFELCQSLKSREKTRKIPVIFLTSREKTDDIVKGFEIGAVDYITKPFKAAELLARIGTHVEMSRMREELEQALENIKILSGLIPICSHCKNIRDDKGYWDKIENYIESRSSASFTHGICPDCLKKHYPELSEKILKAKKEAEEKAEKDKRSDT